MAYNHLKEKVKGFLQPFAQSGQAVSAEDVKDYFAKLRGDDEAVKAEGSTALIGGDGRGDDNRREQNGKPDQELGVHRLQPTYNLTRLLNRQALLGVE